VGDREGPRQLGRAQGQLRNHLGVRPHGEHRQGIHLRRVRKFEERPLRGANFRIQNAKARDGGHVRRVATRVATPPCFAGHLVPRLSNLNGSDLPVRGRRRRNRVGRHRDGSTPRKMPDGRRPNARPPAPVALESFRTGRVLISVTPFVFDRSNEQRHPGLSHYLFRFPAKFHPPVARALLERHAPKRGFVLDPFCGSGTLLVVPCSRWVLLMTVCYR
jgi:hypothetical protein